MTDGIKVLFLAANPVSASSRLRLDEEVREIVEKIQAGVSQDSFEIVSQWAVRPSDLAQALLRHRPHIIHFSGHGSRAQGIILEDEEGNLKPVGKQALAGLFRILKDNIRIVFLNACHSKRQMEAFRETIDFTIVIKCGYRRQSGHSVCIILLSSSSIWTFGAGCI
jgi:CHAT domain-containing protein